MKQAEDLPPEYLFPAWMFDFLRDTGDPEFGRGFDMYLLGGRTKMLLNHLWQEFLKRNYLEGITGSGPSEPEHISGEFRDLPNRSINGVKLLTHPEFIISLSSERTNRCRDGKKVVSDFVTHLRRRPPDRAQVTRLFELKQCFFELSAVYLAIFDQKRQSMMNTCKRKTANSGIVITATLGTSSIVLRKTESESNRINSKTPAPARNMDPMRVTLKKVLKRIEMLIGR